MCIYDETQYLSNFKNKLITLREERGKTQKDVCSALFLNAQTYSRYENGKRIPNIIVAKQLADYFGVTLDGLLGADNTTTDDITHFSNVTGLSEKAIKALISLKTTDYALSKIVNQLIESGYLKCYTERAVDKHPKIW